MTRSVEVARGRRVVANAAFSLGLLFAAFPARAEDVRVAVAANFAAPMKEIAAQFERETGNRVLVSVGSTGGLYAQLKNGAPFELLLSADEQTPKRLEDDGAASAGLRFTYAIGKLVLYSPEPGFVDDQGRVLRAGNYKHLAIANPKTAPYGAAAVEALRHLGIWDGVQAKLVQGESISQAFQFVASGNAELGFVALSQIDTPGHPARGSWWLVPENLYSPIRQDAILLKSGENQPAARALFDYLRSEKVKRLIHAYGYNN